jgi:hypothetical protein
VTSPPATYGLQAHPRTPCSAVDEVVVDVSVAADGVLVLRWAIVGELERMRIPAPGSRLDPERLWAHTCCESFVAPASGEDYVEWNFSPTGQIALFAFSEYRKRTTAPTIVAHSVVTRIGRELRLEARVPLHEQRVRLSLTAVVEDADGALSYWALRHPRDRPDFHDPDGFALTLTLGPPSTSVLGP